MKYNENMYKPISFWSWNGKMKTEEIVWQIEEFKEKGFGGFFIHARAGRLISYLGEDWFGACSVAIDTAKRLGLDVWLYDEDGWPSGFAGGLVNGCGENYCAKKLSFCEEHPVGEDVEILAVYCRNIDGSYRKIENTEATEGDLYCYYEIDRHYVDIMEAKVSQKFLEVTHEVYKHYFGEYFGSVIKGVFTDEPRLLDGPCWSDTLQLLYKDTYKTDILEDLWLLYVEHHRAATFRYRFWYCTNQLIKKNYAAVINNWCKENHLLATGHFSHEDGLAEQVYGNGGVMPLYEEMGLPGIDHLGNRYASPVLMKQVTSVAQQRGISQVLSESFGCAGWDVSFKDLMGIVGWQAVFGVNTICAHLSAYSICGRRKRDYPACYSYQEPWWKQMGQLNRAIQKMNQMISEGKRATNVAVLHPMRSVWCYSGYGLHMRSKVISAQFRELVEHLLDLHIDFDLLDEGRCEDYRIAGDRIEVGEKRYSWIIVPAMDSIAERTVCMLQDFAKNGGHIVFIDQRPFSIEGDENHAWLKKLQQIEATELTDRRELLQKYFQKNPVDNDFHLLDTDLKNEISGLVSYYGNTTSGAIVYLFNPTAGHTISTSLKLRGNYSLEEMDVITEGVYPISTEYADGYTYGRVKVEAGSGILIRAIYLSQEKMEQEEPGQEEAVEACEIRTLVIEKTELMDKNSYTLDYGCLSIDGEVFSDRKPILWMLDEIYSRVAEKQSDTQVCIEYSFEVAFDVTPEKLYLAVEHAEQLCVQCNGVTLETNGEWWIDKGIQLYDIHTRIRTGMNKILLTYTIPSVGMTNTTDGKFESERNRFFYPVEPESIYLYGDFDVRCNGEVTYDGAAYALYETEKTGTLFTLVDRKERQAGDLIAQNTWFYRGNCKYKSTYRYKGTGSVYIRLERFYGFCAEIYVNSKKMGLVASAAEMLDITNQLHQGENVVEVIVVGHNRNLLGPHHHQKKKLCFVGPSSFAGVKGWEDFVNADITEDSTWTNRYSFVPFGLGGITVITKN